jgi:surface antigen
MGPAIAVDLFGLHRPMIGPRIRARGNFMKIGFLRRFKPVILATTMGVMLTPVPAMAQFGSLFGSKSGEVKSEELAAVEEPAVLPDPQNPEITAADENAEPVEQAGANSFDTLCGNGQGKADGSEVEKKRKGLFGMADRMASVTRKIPLVGDFLVDSANSLSQSVACRLYPEEQEQAAEATQEATRNGEIGKTVAWQSSVRENVSGSSTISSKNEMPDGTPCMVLADIVIVDGEELRVSKTMCKLPGSGHYTIIKA